MFTGIIDHVGEIKSIKDNGSGITLTINHQFGLLVNGESISIDGVCLTCIHSNPGSFDVELSSETIRRSGSYAVGNRVNLERALRASDRLGGHWVTGHVDETGSLIGRREESEFVQMEFSSRRREFLVEKGSIAVNGVSLTINSVGDNSFRVMVIPHTLARTNLGSLSQSDFVNLEYDYLAKLVHHQVSLGVRHV